MAVKRLRGIPYQRHGAAERGEAAPVIEEKTSGYDRT